MPILKNKLPNDLSFNVNGEEVLVPGAVESHNEEGKLTATDGWSEVTDVVLEALKLDEEAVVYFQDGALYVYEEFVAESEGGEI